MKKLSALALITAMGIAGSTVVPVQAASQQNIAQQLKNNGYVVINGKVSSPEELKSLLSGLCGHLEHIDWTDCPVITWPDGNKPEMPDTDVPDTDTPDTDVPDTDTPDTDVPDTDTPDTDVPDADIPDTDVPDTDKPGTDVPDTDAPGNDKPGTDSEAQTYAQQVVALVNAERAKAGLGTLTLDTEIEAAALIRAKETEVSFSHTRPDGRQFSSALTDMGITFRGAGENIAWGQKSPEEVMNGWMNSEGHRANILNPKFTKIGVGYYQNPAGRNFWTQLFTY